MNMKGQPQSDYLYIHFEKGKCKGLSYILNSGLKTDPVLVAVLLYPYFSEDFFKVKFSPLPRQWAILLIIIELHSMFINIFFKFT